MAIVSGYQKMKDYIKQTSGYQLLSRWANANTLECDDGKTLQDKVGGISGISSSLTANSTTQAASTNLTNQLYQNISKIDVYIGEDGKLHFTDGTGADTVLNFSSKPILIGSYSLAQGSTPTTVNIANKVTNYKNLTADNFLYKVTSISELDWTSGSWGTNKYSQSYNSETGYWSIVIS